MPETTIAVPAHAATDPGEQSGSELARFRSQIREGKVPDLTAQTAPAAAGPVTVVEPLPPPQTPTTPEPDEIDPVTKAPSKRQHYINELIRAQTRAELRAEQLERDLEDARRVPRTRADTTPEPQSMRPMPTEDQVGTTYQTYGEYVADVTKWQIEQVEAARTRTEQDRTSQYVEQQALAAYQSRIPAAQARHTDFDAVIARPLPAPLTPTLRSALLASEVGPELAYYLTTHPEEYSRIRALPMGPALMAIGRLEAQLETAPAASHHPVPLPAPMAPVGGHSTTGTPDIATVNDLRTFRDVIKPKFGMSGR